MYALRNENPCPFNIIIWKFSEEENNHINTFVVYVINQN